MVHGELRLTGDPQSAGPRRLSRFVQQQPTLVAVLLVLLAMAVLFPYRHFAGDDAYITFHFARHFAEGSGFAFNAGVPTYGSTAPLWVLMIAGLHQLGMEVPAAAHALNWLFSALDVLLFFRLAMLYLGRGSAAVLATLLFLLDPWFIHWAISGMENSLALALLMAMFLSQLWRRNSGRVNWIAPVFAGLAGLCRPEMVLLSGLLLLDNLLLERRRLIANVVVAAVAYLAIFAPWLWYAFSVFHSPIPNTISAKISADHLLALERVILYFGTFWIFQGLALAAVFIYQPLRKRLLQQLQGSPGMWLLPAAWAVMLPAFYIAGGAPVGGRYMVFGLPSYLLIGVAAWKIIWGNYPRQVGGLIAATLMLLLVVQYKYCWYITRWPQGMDPRIIEAALTLKQISRDTDQVAADQIGVLGYFSERQVLDTFGLASPEILPYRKIADPAAVWRYVHQRGVQFLFVINTIEELRGLDSAYNSLMLVKAFPVQREGARTADVPTLYYLYRTNWDAEKSGQ